MAETLRMIGGGLEEATLAVVRARLAEVETALAAVSLRSGDIAASMRWRSSAAEHFRTASAEWCADVGEIASTLTWVGVEATTTRSWSPML